MKVLGDNPDIGKITYPFFSAYKYGPEPIFQREAPIHTETPGLDNEKETFQNAFDALITKINLAEEDGKIPFIMNHAYFLFDPDVIARNLNGLYGMEQRSKIRRPIIIDNLDTALPNHTTGGEEASESIPQSRLENVVANNMPPNPTLLPISFLQSITTPIFIIRHPARFIPSFYRAARDAGYDVALDGPEFAISATLRWTRLLFEWFVANNDSGDDTDQTNNDTQTIPHDIE